MSDKTVTKTVTLFFNSDTKVYFKDSFDGEDISNGEWYSPFPNTNEDSLVFGLIESYGQSDNWVGALLYEEGEPDKVIIFD